MLFKWLISAEHDGECCRERRKQGGESLLSKSWPGLGNGRRSTVNGHGMVSGRIMSGWFCVQGELGQQEISQRRLLLVVNLSLVLQERNKRRWVEKQKDNQCGSCHEDTDRVVECPHHRQTMKKEQPGSRKGGLFFFFFLRKGVLKGITEWQIPLLKDLGWKVWVWSNP